jgi:hypothetical protein
MLKRGAFVSRFFMFDDALRNTDENLTGISFHFINKDKRGACFEGLFR